MVRKIFFHVLIFALLISACAPQQVTVTSQVTATLSPTETPTPTEIHPTATSTIEPSPTVDPNAPPGWTGKDVQGYIMKKDGITYHDTTIVDSNGNEIYRGWFRSLNYNNERIPLLDLPDQSNNIGLPDQQWLKLGVGINVQGADKVGTLQRLKESSDPSVDDFTDEYYTYLMNRIGVKTKNPFIQINEGKISLSYSIPSGIFDWKLGPNTNVNVFIIDNNSAKSQGFTKVKDPFDKKGENYLYVKFYGVKGDVVCMISSDAPIDTLNESQLAEIFLFAPASILDGQDQMVPHFNDTLNKLSSMAFAKNKAIFKINK